MQNNREIDIYKIRYFIYIRSICFPAKETNIKSCSIEYCIRILYEYYIESLL